MAAEFYSVTLHESHMWLLIVVTVEAKLVACPDFQDGILYRM